MKKALLVLIVPLLLLGCGNTPVEVNHFDPVLDQPHLTKIVREDDDLVSCQTNKFKVVAALYEYNSVIVMPLNISNKTGQTIQPKDYSISLHDGRDLKKIKMLTRTDLVKIKGKLEGSGSGGGGGGIESMALEATVNAIMSATSMPTKNLMLKGLDHAINDYFEFRPIWANETRAGLLCFLVDFKLEYPLTLALKVRDERIDLKFRPRPKKDD